MRKETMRRFVPEFDGGKRSSLETSPVEINLSKCKYPDV